MRLRPLAASGRDGAAQLLATNCNSKTFSGHAFDIVFCKIFWVGDGGVSMKTAEHYRALAEECIKWAAQAYTNEVRGSYLQLARIWLDTASRLSDISVSGMVPDEPARSSG